MRTRKTKTVARVRRAGHLERSTSLEPPEIQTTAARLVIHLPATSELHDQAEDFSWESKHALVYLISDLVGACGGTPLGCQDGSFAAQFAHPDRALTAAKRIQLALLGFAKRYANAPILGAMAVQALEAQVPDSADPIAGSPIDWQSILKSARPGQILVAAPICDFARKLGECRQYTGQEQGEVYEFVWADAEIYDEFRNVSRRFAEAARAGDQTPGLGDTSPTVVYPESLTTGNIPARNQDALGDAPSLLPQMDRRAIQRLADKFLSLLTALWRAPVRLKLAAIAAIAVVGLAVPLSYHYLHKVRRASTQDKSRQAVSNSSLAITQPVQPTKTESSRPDTSASAVTGNNKPAAGSAVVGNDKPAALNSGSQPGKEADTMAQGAASSPTAHQKKESSGGRCDLYPSLIAGYLEMADRNRARGKYGDAEREYNAVLGCDPHNARAHEGLAKTRAAKALPFHN